MSNRDMSRRNRHDAIRDLIDRDVLSRQDQIVDRLKAQGFDVTQSSISRDLAQLNVSKLGGRYVLPKMVDAKIPEIRDFWEAGDSLIVIKTEPADAGRLARTLDELDYKSYIGSVAGDDTVFVACRQPEYKRRLMQDLERFRNESSG